ncbi:MAG TPA: glycosyltransferase family 1 protein [Anaeromyxobacteraceae bacterium]|nr:glycosyltransferase family 1 protein [Anaeromyxobacteraceae bacterium]
MAMGVDELSSQLRGTISFGPSGVGAPVAAAQLEVCLLHDYHERAQMSMKLYAEHLGRALEGEGFRVRRVRPGYLLPEVLRGNRWVSKIDSLAGRYLLYPVIARRQCSDVFHVVDHGQGHLVRSLDGGRTVVTCHDVMLLLVAAGRLRCPDRPLLATRLLRDASRALKRAARIVAVSEQTRRDLAEVSDVDPARIEVVPNGLDPAFRPLPGAREEMRERLGLGNRPVVLHVGKPNFYKNISGCLEIVAELRRLGVDAILLRAGPLMRPEHRHLAHMLGIAPVVRELGPVPGDVLPRIYHAADVFLFPSLYEGFGWPPCEAMACGTPVVCSRNGSLGEVVGDAALTADAEDVPALARHLEAVLSDPGLAQTLRERGRARAAKFDWPTAARRIGAIYRDIVGG